MTSEVGFERGSLAVVKPKMVHPDGTGYVRGLYAIEGLPEETANVLETLFLKPADGLAAEALQAVVSAPFVNTGLKFLNGFDYLFDADGGFVGFRWTDHASQAFGKAVPISPSNRAPQTPAGSHQLAAGALRGRDASCLAPPAQIRTCGCPAYGSHLLAQRLSSCRS